MADERQCKGCGSSRGMTREQKLTELPPTPGQNGVIELLNYPDCWSPYHGPHRMESIWMVGRGTEHETLFPNAGWQPAQELAKSHTPYLRIARVSATQLCQDAVKTLFGE
jgi:hypothetical protein